MQLRPRHCCNISLRLKPRRHTKSTACSQANRILQETNVKRAIQIAVIAAAGCAGLIAQSSTKQEEANKRMALNWYREVVANGHTELAPKYMADAYIEHNPNMSGGRAEFVAAIG